MTKRKKWNGPVELLGAAERKTWEDLAPKYQTSDPLAYALLVEYCRNSQLIHDADALIRKHGLNSTGGNGAVYQNPAVGTRNKASALRLQLLKKLDQYQKQGTEEVDLPV